jgi:hypothetical protein
VLSYFGVGGGKAFGKHIFTFNVVYKENCIYFVLSMRLAKIILK